MSRLFESFEYLDRGWDVRALEGQLLCDALHRWTGVDARPHMAVVKP